jgi:uncharacterized protein (DUF885 family)
MKCGSRRLCRLALAAGVAASLGRVSAQAAAAPSAAQAVAAAAEEYWQYLLSRSPSLRLKHGLPVTSLPDASHAEAERDTAFARRLLARLEGVDAAALEGEDRLTLEVLRHDLGALAEMAAQDWFIFPVTPYRSSFPEVQRVFATWRLRAPADLDAYLALLARVPAFVTSVRGKLEAQARRGIHLPREEIALVAPFLSAYAGEGDASPFQVAPERLTAIEPARATTFRGEVARRIAADVAPSVRDLVRLLEGEYRPAAPEAVGIGQYPGGAEAYRSLVRLHTTVEVTPEEVHRFGLAEVERLRGEMKAVRDSLGFAGNQAEFHQMLRTDPRFRAQSAEAIGERLRRHAAAIEPKVDAFFLRRPRAPYGVKRLDPTLEGAQTYGYYQVPTAGDPAGYYMFNGSRPTERPLVNAAALIYHELVPGHHFQIARQMEDQALPAFRRESYHTAYGEGWGEYASKLALEMGLYQDPYDRYGRLLMEMFLATRLVVDTGMNALGWPRSRAVEFMRGNVLESDTQLHTETLRYSVDMPGQALAYQIGSTRLQALRKKVEAALGPRFDVRRFHEAVLGSGSLPLPVLERHLDRFIAAERSSLPRPPS